MNLLLGICFRAAEIILVWILCQVASIDLSVSGERGVEFDRRLLWTWLEKSSHFAESIAL